nr:phosphatidate cytidylyltransferase, mitochondrial [Quercus suber]
MSCLPKSFSVSPSSVGAHSFLLARRAWQPRSFSIHNSPPRLSARTFTICSKRSNSQQSEALQRTDSPSQSPPSPVSSSSATTDSKTSSSSGSTKPNRSTFTRSSLSLPPGWEDTPTGNITEFSQLPHKSFGHNQFIQINAEFKETLRQILWQFRAPIRYALAYGSGVFGQKSSSSSADVLSPHPNPPKAVEEWQKGGAKVIDFIFGVSHTQHWHSLNLVQNPQHYSGLRFLPYSSACISAIQDKMGAGVYFNPFINVNGVMIKYGVVNLDTLARDLSEWDTLYLAGRLQKPVKILRDDPRIRLANQVNLISALRTALLMLPEKFTERQLYERIAGLSYLGDPRMNQYIASENPNKVSNIVGAQLPGFRQLYVPLIHNLPNVDFSDSRTPRDEAWEKVDAIRHIGSSPQLDDVLGGEDGLTLSQDLDPHKRGNMVRRLPKAFRKKLYYQYKKSFQIPGSAFEDILDKSGDEDPQGFRKTEGGDFEMRIGKETDLPDVVAQCVRQTVAWPSTSQTIKSFFTAGFSRAWKYYAEKRRKGSQKATAVKQVAKDEKITAKA